MATSAAMTRTTVPRLRNSTVRAGLLRCVWRAVTRPDKVASAPQTAPRCRKRPRSPKPLRQPPSRRHQRQPPRRRLLAERVSRKRTEDVVSIAPVRPRRSAHERRAAANAACARDSGTLGGGARARVMRLSAGAWSAALTPVNSALLRPRAQASAGGVDAQADRNGARVVRCHTSSTLAAAAAHTAALRSRSAAQRFLPNMTSSRSCPFLRRQRERVTTRGHLAATGCAQRTWCTSHPTPPARGKGGTPDVARRTSARAREQSKRSARVAPPQPAPFTRFACTRRLLAAARSCAAP